MNMNANEILVSMARYIHAVYDIEIDDNDPNLNIETKKYVEEYGKKDEALQSYWDSYISTLTGKVIVKEAYRETETKKSAVKEDSIKPVTSTYRGAKVELQGQNKKASNNKSGVLYRGQTL